LLGYLNAEVVKEDIFKPTTENESLKKISDNNTTRAVNFDISKNSDRQK
jgi:hypothetical protein